MPSWGAGRGRLCICALNYFSPRFLLHKAESRSHKKIRVLPQPRAPSECLREWGKLSPHTPAFFPPVWLFLLCLLGWLNSDHPAAKC